MTELKTLKDLKRWNGGLRFRNKDFIETSKLKAEAVKCAKYYYEMMQTSEFHSDYFYFKGRYDEIIERNDLTEEDLK